MSMLSPHFSFREMTTTNTGLDNTPHGQHLVNLQFTAQMMEQVRALLGHPITVNSAYRSPTVNRKVGGVPTSAHALGFAVDFTCWSYGTPYDICQAIARSGIQFDQLILEKNRWVHIGFGPRKRQQLLTLPPNGRRYELGINLHR